jgi:hypothetical protein
MSLKMGDNTYRLSGQNINTTVDERIGNYAFGILVESLFHPKYIGRSDTNLKDEMYQQYNNKVNNELKTYTHFKFIYYNDPITAYHHECDNYHYYVKTLDNEIHPDKPNGLGDNSGLSCVHNCGYDD